MFIVAQRVCVTIHKRTNVSFTTTKFLCVSEEVVWIIIDFCYRAAYSPQNVSYQGGYHITVFQAQPDVT